MTETLATKEDVIGLQVRFAEQEARIELRFAELEKRFDIRLSDLEKRLELRLTMRLGGIMVAGITIVSVLVKLL